MRLDNVFLGLLIWFLTFIKNSTRVPCTEPVHHPDFTPRRFPITCLAVTPLPATIEALIDCFDKYTVPDCGYATEFEYNNAQPWHHNNELSALSAAVVNLLEVDCTCGPAILPPALNDIYVVNLFTEVSGKSFCILSEKTYDFPKGHYSRGWGLMAVPANHAGVSRDVHISAPHPTYDRDTPQHAAATFKNTGAKSLFVSGRHRDAFHRDIPNGHSCIGPKYSKTDAAHDISKPFFAVNKQIRLWQDARGCPIASCAYIQIHRQKSCELTDDVYLSAGIGKSNYSKSWYDNNDSPAKRIRDELRISFLTWTISMPSDPSSCHLTATLNVFGRLLNRIPESEVCTRTANFHTVTGQFVHIEQTDEALLPINYANFAKAVNRAIGTTCKPPMQMHPVTLLCV